MSTANPASNTLRTHGLQFIKLFQGALRLMGLYTREHDQVQRQIERAYAPLQHVFEETHSLSISFQYDRVVLNTLVWPEPALAPLAGELAKRGIGAVVFLKGISEASLGRMLSLLVTKPESIQEAGGLVKFLQANPLERARIIPAQLAMGDGSLAVGATDLAAAAMEGAASVAASSEMIETMARIPNWVLLLLQELRISGQTISSEEMAQLSDRQLAQLSPQQIASLQQMQDLLARVAQRASLGALAEVIRTVRAEAGAASAKLLEPALLRSLVGCLETGDLKQAENILLAISELQGDPAETLKQLPAKLSEETKRHFERYLAWLKRSKEERLKAKAAEGGHELRWLAVDTEHALIQGHTSDAGDFLLALLKALGLAEERVRAEVLPSVQRSFTGLCAGGLSHPEPFVEALSERLLAEESPQLARPLLESLALLTQTAVERQSYVLAASSAGPIDEMRQESSPRGELAREVHSRMLSTDTVSTLVRTFVTRREDPEIGRNLLGFLKRIGDHAGREMLVLLEKEPVASKRSRILQAIKRLDRSAIDAISEKLSDPQWYVVRNAVLALAELSDPSLLARLEPALAHPDGRVQKEAVAAMQKTRSPLRAVPLARALTLLKPAQIEDVLDDLVVLKDPQTIPYLVQFVHQVGGDTKAHLLQKGIAALGAIVSTDSANALLGCVKNPGIALPVRQAAVRALARMDVPEARPLLAEFGRTTTEAALAKLTQTLLKA